MRFAKSIMGFSILIFCLGAGGPGDDSRILQHTFDRTRNLGQLKHQDNTEGAPGSKLEPGSWGCLLSSLFDVDRHQPSLSSLIKPPTAPPPISRMFHQSANQAGERPFRT